jgi:hypothetical protein
MIDQTGKTWMAIGESDDPNAEIESFLAAAAVTKGDVVYLSEDGKVSPGAAAVDAIGVAIKAQATVDEPVPVLTKGRVKVAAGEAIAVNSAVYGADSDSRVLQLDDQDVCEGGAESYTVYYNRRLGRALQEAESAGDLIFIKVKG